MVYRYIKSALRLTLPVLTYDLKQNEVEKETTHPPEIKAEAGLPCSRFCFVTQWGGALRKETKTAARETRMKPPKNST